MKFYADTHAHTLVSGHAYSTIREMAKAAKARGLQLQALTEHGPKMRWSCGVYYFLNLDVIPREMEGVELLFGVELNILDPEGTVDLPEKVYEKLDIVIASLHEQCYSMEHSEKENTTAYVNALKNPHIHILGHPDDGKFPVDYETIVKTAKETGKLLELNNASLSPASFRLNARKNALTILDLCKQYEQPITTGSDAHVDTDAGNFCYIEELVNYCKFPEELILTTDAEKIKTYLKNMKAKNSKNAQNNTTIIREIADFMKQY